MSDDRLRRLRDLFDEAMKRPEAERGAFAAAACGDDRALCDQLLALLAPGDTTFRPLVDLAAPVAGLPQPESARGETAFALGEIVADRYRVTRFLARGGMGEVYRADDLELGVPVALKTIRSEIASDAASLHRFKQEVLLARSVTHPNVCRIFDIGRHRDAARDMVFLTMEFLEGESLSARVRERGRLSPEESLPIVRQLAEALDAAHRAGIVHRDFKGPNVMLVPAKSGERAVITDFGLALPVGAGVSAVTEASPGDRGDPVSTAMAGDPRPLVGTPAYMSPEQVRGEPIGPATDLYALGVVVFEMATGVLPFQRATPVETAMARLYEEPPRPSTFAKTDPHWEAVILRLLAPEPEARFPCARDVVRLLEGRPVEVGSVRGTLPAEPDGFVGRERELGVLAAHVEQDPEATGASTGRRLLTLRGPGGMGKTRLARRYGWRSLPRWSGGVWFADLTEARSVDGIAAAVAAGLEVPLMPGDAVAQLGHALDARGRALVILDNFEHVAAHAEATLGKWLARPHEVCFLVTSRERLHLEGETTLEIEPLSEEQGIELFALRAGTHRPGFAITDANRAAVAEIIARLDGLPLAIELAAARLRMLGLDELRERLEDRLHVLAGGRRGRHGTLRATLDWSWELLEPWERAAVAEISVFDGGLSLVAAEAVLDLSPWPDAPPVLDVVQSLVDKSWLRARSAEQRLRFDMYATVREYAAEKLGDAVAFDADVAKSTAAGDVVRRHGAFYASFGTVAALEALDRHGGASKRRTLRLEVDNLVTACRRALSRGDVAVAVDTYAAAWEVLGPSGPVAAAVALGREVCAVSRSEPPLHARALVPLGHAELLNGSPDHARECYEEALFISRELDDGRRVCNALGQLARLDFRQGRMADASRRCLDALALARAAGDRRAEAFILVSLARIHHRQGRVEEAEGVLGEALAVHREVGNRAGEAVALGVLGSLHAQQGRREKAHGCAMQALSIHRELGSRAGEALVLGNLGSILRDRGLYEEARGYFRQALAIQREIGNIGSQGTLLGFLAILDAEEGRLEEAERHLEETLAIHRATGNRRYECVALGNLGSVHTKRGQLDTARRFYEESLAILRDMGDRYQAGIVITNLGGLAAREGRTDEARKLYEEALTDLRETGHQRYEALTQCALATLHRDAGRYEDARRDYEEAATILREVDDRLGLAKLLCGRAELERRTGRLAAAHSTLGEATAIAAALKTPSGSELSESLTELRDVLAGDG